MMTLSRFLTITVPTVATLSFIAVLPTNAATVTATFDLTNLGHKVN
ncbi:hypothetical protein cce_1221 [Crocosphaera subtropica ATCC 51142]|uniref:Uncharacterized protein n=1 Tax=Crocosphaera subtropica (strain ATCC 51142 / BH68) TaxID=43989 RepID=B1WUX0_CROS5|nr:hypothetical protein [Crocosphaera subtropica]ACB50571.1 hypothetical protein cce_1221 [Crocosphaera subtropica ATCC 51142]